MHHEPARTIIEKLGGPRVVARITGKDVSRVYRWMYPRERGGSDGYIPYEEAEKILAEARRMGLPITPVDFFRPASPESEPATGECADA